MCELTLHIGISISKNLFCSISQCWWSVLNDIAKPEERTLETFFQRSLALIKKRDMGTRYTKYINVGVTTRFKFY